MTTSEPSDADKLRTAAEVQKVIDEMEKRIESAGDS